MSSDSGRLVCPRIDESSVHIDGEISTQCTDCGAKVAVSLSGQSIMARGVRVVCLPCAASDIDVEEIVITDETLAEARAHIGQHVTREYLIKLALGELAWMRRRT